MILAHSLSLVIYNFSTVITKIFFLASEKWFQYKENEEDNFHSIREKFYHLTGQTFETQCMVIKKFGGNWNPDMKIVDGEKPVCLDKIYHDLQNGNCLVYSFGVGDEFSFEVAMADLGCTVRAFDLNIDTKDKSFVSHHNITFSLTGLSHVRGRSELGKILILNINRLSSITDISSCLAK